LAESYINAAARESDAAAELAASLKEDKYADLDGRYIFEPIAIETLGAFNTSARQLLSDLGRKISESTGEAREARFLFQRCFVLVQRFNAIYCFMTVYQPMTAATECSYPSLYFP